MARKETVMDNVLAAGRQVWLAGLGAVAVADEEGRNLLGRLVDEGARFEKSDRNVVGKKLEGLGDRVESKVQRTVASMLHRVGIPTHDEIRNLIDRVERLTEKVEAR